MRTLETERLDRATGELRPVRQDLARRRSGGGGVEGIVWGAKFRQWVTPPTGIPMKKTGSIP